MQTTYPNLRFSTLGLPRNLYTLQTLPPKEFYLVLARKYLDNLEIFFLIKPHWLFPRNFISYQLCRLNYDFQYLI
jgi:hypothetical protein